VTALLTESKKLRRNADLSKTNWFRVGGPAEWLFKPENTQDLSEFLQQLPPDMPVTVLGVGSNVIVRDGGIDGVVVKLGRNFASASIVPPPVGGRSGGRQPCSDEAGMPPPQPSPYGGGSIHVNTAHHQAAGATAPGVIVNATTSDGVIESIELPSHPFCLGVQWHPEYHVDAADSKIFAAFVAACKESKQ